jgi:phosphoribosylformylglycinamidine cyclo-ligase
MIAILLEQYNTVGIDLVAMCANDLVASGIKPAIFLDCISMGKQYPLRTAEIVAGIAKGCHLAEMAIFGGEMAEMPGLYKPKDFDLVGCAIGFAGSKKELITGESIKPDMFVYGLPSSGVHSNGFSLIRKIFDLSEDDPERADALLSATWLEIVDGRMLGAELLKPTKIYVKDVEKIRAKYEISGIVHVTGGGLVENPPRILPDGCAMELHQNKWNVPDIFPLVQSEGSVSDYEMRKTFNMGLGMLIVSPEKIRGMSPVGRIVKSDTKDTIFVE